jgi:hypothetical protein
VIGLLSSLAAQADSASGNSTIAAILTELRKRNVSPAPLLAVS